MVHLSKTKYIAGTAQIDLRKLTMRQMAQILISCGLDKEEIDTLRRWDRVHVIREFAASAASKLPLKKRPIVVR